MENHILKGLHLDGDRDVTDNNCDGDKPFSPYVHIGPLTVTEQRERGHQILRQGVMPLGQAAATHGPVASIITLAKGTAHCISIQPQHSPTLLHTEPSVTLGACTACRYC